MAFCSVSLICYHHAKQCLQSFILIKDVLHLNVILKHGSLPKYVEQLNAVLVAGPTDSVRRLQILSLWQLRSLQNSLFVFFATEAQSNKTFFGQVTENVSNICVTVSCSTQLRRLPSFSYKDQTRVTEPAGAKPSSLVCQSLNFVAPKKFYDIRLGEIVSESERGEYACVCVCVCVKERE